MNATREVSAYELVGELAGGTALVMAGVSLHPKVRERIDRRRNRRLDLDGRPPRFGKDENGAEIVIEKGRPPLAAMVHDIAEKVDQIAGELTRNGGSSLADAVHRMERNLNEKHEENQRDIAMLRDTAEANADNLTEVKSLVGEAAMQAASADQRVASVDQRVASVDQRVRQLAGEIDAMTNAALADHAHLWTALSEMGYERRGEPDAP